MPTVDVTPGDLRAASSTISQARVRLQGAQDQELLADGPETPISVGGFQPGELAQRYLRQKGPAMHAAADVIDADYAALSSALQVVAELYTSADHREAAGFASMSPGVAPLGGNEAAEPAD